MTDEELPIILCGRIADGPYPFNDNIAGECADCKEPILWRPHSPPGIRVCFKCGMLRIAEHEQQGEQSEYQITKETENDLRELGWTLKRGIPH